MIEFIAEQMTTRLDVWDRGWHMNFFGERDDSATTKVNTKQEVAL